MAASEFCNTESMTIEEKCLKTCMLLAASHVNSQSPMQKLHAKFFSIVLPWKSHAQLCTPPSHTNLYSYAQIHLDKVAQQWNKKNN